MYPKRKMKHFEEQLIAELVRQSSTRNSSSSLGLASLRSRQRGRKKPRPWFLVVPGSSRSPSLSARLAPRRSRRSRRHQLQFLCFPFVPHSPQCSLYPPARSVLNSAQRSLPLIVHTNQNRVRDSKAIEKCFILDSGFPPLNCALQEINTFYTGTQHTRSRVYTDIRFKFRGIEPLCRMQSYIFFFTLLH